MVFGLKNEGGKKAAFRYIEELEKQGINYIEVGKKRVKRTLKQNAYLHLLLQIFAIEYGDTLEYCKETIYKDVVNPQIFRETYKTKTGRVGVRLRSSADLNTKELAQSIDRFKDFSARELGIMLPDADQVENGQMYVENNKRHLF